MDLVWNISLALALASLISADTEILIIGGQSETVPTLKTIEVYNPSDPSKNGIVAVMPEGRLAPSLVKHADSVFILGGYGGNYADTPMETVQIFYLSNKSFRPGPNMTEKRADSGATVFDNKIWICGGFGLKDNAPYYIKSCEYLDPLSNSWKSGPSMLQTRLVFSLVSVADSLFAISGQDADRTACERLDSKTNQWTKMNPLPHGRWGTAAVAYGEMIVACGGQQINLCHQYNPKDNTWRQFHNMISARMSFSLVSYNSDIYALGGHGDYDNSVEVYRNDKKPWENAGDLKIKRWATTAVAL